MRSSSLSSSLLRSVAAGLFAFLLAGCGGDDPEQADRERDPVDLEFISLDLIDETVRGLDPNAQRQDTAWQFQVRGYPVFVIADPSADRIRIQVPVTQSARLTARDWRRVTSANFDTAIDARYAAARDILWSVFVHRFSTLTKEDFLSGLQQCLNLMATYGTAYASTNQVFSGGDTATPENGDSGGN